MNGSAEEETVIEEEFPGHLELCYMWLWCMKEERELSRIADEVGVCYKQYVSSTTDYELRKELMIDYMVSSLHFESEKEVLQECIKNYESELLELVKKMECQDLQRKVKQLKRKYSMFVLDLKEVYCEKQKMIGE